MYMIIEGKYRHSDMMELSLEEFPIQSEDFEEVLAIAKGDSCDPEARYLREKSVSGLKPKCIYTVEVWDVADDEPCNLLYYNNYGVIDYMKEYNDD